MIKDSRASTCTTLLTYKMYTQFKRKKTYFESSATDQARINDGCDGHLSKSFSLAALHSF